MKIELTDVSPVKKTLAVEADPDEVARETDTVVRRYASQVRVPGFRQGKVPLDIVRKRFAKDIEDDVKERLVSRLYAEAAREKKLRPVSDPVLDELVHEHGRPFAFKASFEVVPDFSVKNYRGVEVRRPEAAVSEEDVDRALESLRESQARFTAEDGRAAVAGDVLVADFEERVEDGEPFRRERAMIEVGGSEQIPAFNDALMGASAGRDLDFAVNYPPDYRAARLAGKTVRYTVKVHEVKRKELPALDDEFAKDMGDFTDLQALRSRVRADLEERKGAEAGSAVRQGVLDKVLLDNPIPLPDSLVEEEIHHRLEDMVRAMMYQGVDPRAADFDWKALRDRQEDPARKTVHARLVLDAVADAESIRVEVAEVDERIRAEASRIGEPYETVRGRLQKGGGLEALQTQMVREKSLDFLTSVANISQAE